MRILLLADVPNWAWDKKADAIIKHLPQYDIDKSYSNLVPKIDLSQYNAVHYFGWLDGYNVAQKYPYITSAVSSYNYYLSHLSKAQKELPRYAAIGAVSTQLYNHLRLNIRNLRSDKMYICENGVDHEFFVPEIKKPRKKFIVGFVGQLTSGSFNRRPYDMKGYDHILRHVIEQLKPYSDIEFKIISNNHLTAISADDMRREYHDMDILMSSSFREGTPNPAFEAASCGIPVISTGVGCIPDLISDGHSGYILPQYDNEREATALISRYVAYILHLYNNRELVTSMGETIRKRIESNWTWADRAKQWIPLFENHTRDAYINRNYLRKKKG